MVFGHTQAVDSAAIKANASMESVVLKVPTKSIDSHRRKWRKRIRKLVRKKNDPTSSAYITASEHHLRLIKTPAKSDW